LDQKVLTALKLGSSRSFLIPSRPDIVYSIAVNYSNGLWSTRKTEENERRFANLLSQNNVGGCAGPIWMLLTFASVYQV